MIYRDTGAKMSYYPKLVRILWLTFCSFLCLFIFTTLSPIKAMAVTENHPILIDTDMAYDDWWALIYLGATQQPIMGVLVDGDGASYCNAPDYAGANNANNVLTLSGFQQKVPIMCGAQKAMRGHPFNSSFRQRMTDMLGVHLSPGKNDVITNQSYTDFFAKKLQQYNSVDIIAIGTSTSLAELINQHPEVIHHIHHIYMMGGAINSAGNSYPVMKTKDLIVQWDIYSDAEAFNVLLKSGIPITLFPLDVTNTAPVSIFDWRYRLSKQKNAKAKFLQTSFDKQAKLISRGSVVYYWDPITAVSASNPHIIQYQKEMKICVNTDSESSKFAQIYPCSNGYPISVVFNIKINQFKSIFYRAVMDK
jgi:purine nucleosidase